MYIFELQRNFGVLAYDNAVSGNFLVAYIPAVDFFARGYSRKFVVFRQGYSRPDLYALFLYIAVVTYAARQSYCYRNFIGRGYVFEYIAFFLKLFKIYKI